MSLRAPPYQNGEAARRAPEDDSDVEEEAMANDYREQVQYDGMDDLDRMPSMSNNQDIHAQLQAAATPLEFQATLETKFASYDSYCNLFHYILNSEGPVDLEVPNVRNIYRVREDAGLICREVLLGVGRHRRVHLSVQQLLQLPPTRRPKERQ